MIGIDGSLLPPILPADATVGSLTADAAAGLGLPVGIPVINGCGDGAATTIGSGAERPNEVSVYLGTSGWVAGVTAVTDRAPRPYYRLAHPLHGGLIEIAPILSAGAAGHWARHTLGLTLPESEREGWHGEYYAFTKSLVDSGEMVSGDALHGNDTATTGSVRDGETLLTDGPAAEIKEHFGGYTIVECADLDEALRWAARMPAATGGSVEVRPLVEVGPPAEVHA